MKKSALIIDDDRTQRRVIAKLLNANFDLNFKEAADGLEALGVLDNCEDSNIILIILDLQMPVMGGLEALEIINKKHSHIPVIILSGSNDISDAIKAMKMGAVDFISKPIEGARLDVAVRNTLKMSSMKREISRLKRHSDGGLKFTDIIGHDGGLAENIKVARKFSACDLPVLITGETGTGKEILARAIHGESSRSGQKFVAVNCGAIPEKLVESTFFGHEKGAFTGAVSKALGKFQEAGGGTIFLDEIGEMPLNAQVKLLRVLQQGEVDPVGASGSVPINVRVISATNCNLAEDIKSGSFREDLYFRLNVLHVDMPPLRFRKDDIPMIATNFINRLCASNQLFPKEINEMAMAKLQSHNWDGNVRELENVINRAMAVCENDVLMPDDFSFTLPVYNNEKRQEHSVISLLYEDGSFKTFKDLEQEIISMAIDHHAGNMSQTARVIGIAKSTLYNKLGNLIDNRLS